VRAVVDAFTLDERFDNSIQSKLVVTGPAPSGKRKEVAMRQIAPGRYEADFELNDYGSFLMRADHQKVTDRGDLKSVGVSYGHVSNPYPREYASFEPDLTRLARAAKVGGGSLEPEPKAVFAPGDEKIISQEQLQDRFILTALALLILDLLVRRVRLFDRKFLPRKRRRAA
jgi:hypothetical protein